MEVDHTKFEKTKAEAEETYKKIGEVYCPYFKELVSFNAKGLDHIKFYEFGKARPMLDQYIRLRLLSLAPKVRSLTRHTVWNVRK